MAFISGNLKPSRAVLARVRQYEKGGANGPEYYPLLDWQELEGSGQQELKIPINRERGITGNHGGSGGIGLLLSPLDPILNITTATDLAHQAGDGTGLLHNWKNDTNINVRDPRSIGGFKVITVDKSEIGTRYKADSNNITINTDTQQ